MSQLIQTNTKSFERNSRMWSPWRCGFLLIPLVFALAWFALLPAARAVVPPPDGGYPNFNTAEGDNALFSLTTGAANTAVGWFSLFSNTDGSFNTGVGAGTLLFNIGDQTTGEGTENTAVGAAALLFNTTGNGNTATGAAALLNNTTGPANTANGALALFSNTEGSGNTATGDNALANNTTGNANTANGVQALLNNTQGIGNTADGFGALANTTGHNNTACGINALAANTTGSGNTALGAFVGTEQTTGSNNVYIGFDIHGTAGESDACYISSIFGQTSSGGIPVLINANHKLGTTTSSKRFKEDIKPMDSASEALFSLKPVTFRYKKQIDPASISQFGLVAEEVEKVNPELVVRDKDGKPYSVRYEQINAMLLNEFLKAHRKVEALETTVVAQQKGFESQRKQSEATAAQQQKEIAALTATVKAQASQIQKVSDELKLSKTAPTLAVSNH